MHAYSGSEEQASQFIKLGLKIGLGGAMTYERAKKLQRLAKHLPLQSIVLETDAPDITPAPFHGQRNSPVFLPCIAETLAELRQQDRETIINQTNENVADVFSI